MKAQATLHMRHTVHYYILHVTNIYTRVYNVCKQQEEMSGSGESPAAVSGMTQCTFIIVTYIHSSLHCTGVALLGQECVLFSVE